MSERVLNGIAASEGIAIGPAFCYQPPAMVVPEREPGPPELEFERFERACQQAGLEIDEIREIVLKRTGDEEQAAIFEAHRMIVADPMLHHSVRQRIEAGLCVEQAVDESVKEMASLLENMADELFAARSADVLDIGRRILGILLGAPRASLESLQQPAIIVANDLAPSDTASLDPELALGFCTAAGGLTSHTAILARTLGIPAVVGLGPDLLKLVENGTPLILDGLRGRLTIEPSPASLEEAQALKARRQAGLEVMQALSLEEARTKDGRRVEVGANVGELSSALEAVRFGAEGIGLLRTEFLYLNEARPPSEEKQIEAYRAIFQALGGRPVIVRTLDIGGDKPPSYLHFEPELNPFLGWRGVRICLEDVKLFKTQLRAILRAAAGWNVLVMYPMISGIEELRRANALLEEARAELEAEGLEHADRLPTGIMVETPAAAALAADLAEECDFFSLGTNDLTQYTLAVDRTNARVADLFQPLHPAVLRLVGQTIEAAHGKGRWVGMCGEMAGMLKAIPILLGLGLDEFSMAPRAIPQAKWLIRRIHDAEARRIADTALRMKTAAEIEAFMSEVLTEYDLSPGD